MAFYSDTMCHFSCNNQLIPLPPQTGRVFLPLGLEFGTRGMHAVMQMAGEEAKSRHTVDCGSLCHLSKRGFVPSSTANSSYKKELSGTLKKFKPYCVFPVGLLPQTLFFTLVMCNYLCLCSPLKRLRTSVCVASENSSYSLINK